MYYKKWEDYNEFEDIEDIDYNIIVLFYLLFFL